MKLTLTNGSLEKSPKSVVRVAFVPEKGVRRLVRENGVETIELSIPEGMNRRKFVILCRSIITAAKQFKARKIAVSFADTPALWEGLEETDPAHISQLAAENFEMANFEFKSYKTKPKEGWNQVEELTVYGPVTKEATAGAKKGQVIGEAVNACRELANTPGGDITPRKLAAAAKDAVKSLPVTVTTLGRTQIEKLGMGLLAGVGAGSSNEPTFTVMEYKGGKGAPIVLAGKGITFDSGGLNIKPSNGIYEMHMDMSGGAAVIHTVALAARLKLKRNVIGLIPAAENMLGSNATRPGDIQTSLSGKTVEVTDTDAEGRLVLADAITYAKRFKPAVVVDVATLTGAAHVALGHYASGLMTRDDGLADSLLRLSEESGDYLWRLPMWDEYEGIVKSEFADIQNHSIGQGRYGGATNGAMFLWQFAKELECPYAHLDIAPRMTSAPGDELAKGAAGAPVRLLLSFINEWNG
ncbi:MAG: leucyl aminopeptidase [Patescibacteria group bacterium]